MILMWNKREVHVGYSMEKFSVIRETLKRNNIKNDYKVVDRNNSAAFGTRRGRMGSLGESLKYSKAFYVNVHKRDLEKAQKVLRKLR